MNRVIAAVLVAALWGVSQAEGETVQTISWPRGQALVTFGGEPGHESFDEQDLPRVDIEGIGLCLFVDWDRQDRCRWEMLTINQPAITLQDYAIVGRIRYEGVEPPRLRAWSYFPDGSADCSETAADSGPIVELPGASGWHEFRLPFRNSPGGPPPERLTVHLEFGPGRLWIGPLRLVQELPASPILAWWSNRQAGLIGGIGGSVFGCLGALVGVVGGRGRARRFVLGLLLAMAGCGAACLAVGIVAAVKSQPYHVYYPLLLLGGLLVVIPLGLLPVMKRRYAQLELRKMSAMDVG